MQTLFGHISGKWWTNREKEKAETLNLSGFPPFIA